MVAQNTIDEKFMHRCIELAKLGKANAAPNPMVGSVIVYNDNIIGEGYHKKHGEAHAEVNAINSVKDKELLKQSTIYVSLEPCAHFGKTPPCAELIIKHNIPKVVIGMQDPFAKVNGLGIKKLKDAGCQVSVGVLEKDCINLNKDFITVQKKDRPYIILKWAETRDGLIDKKRNENSPQAPNWITNEVCRSLVHKWRTEVQSIMVGPQTVISDNPKLNVRSWTGENPTRLVIDRYLRLPNHLNVFDKSINTFIYNTLKSEESTNLSYIKIDEENFLSKVFNHLKINGFQTVFVEGGRELLQQLIDQNLWDESRIFTGNVSFIEGTKAPEIKGKIISKDKLKDNYLTVIHNNLYFS